MYLQKLSLINFKNYNEADYSFSPQVNCFVGNNGVGKTNLLDAIYYLSFCKSFLNPIDNQNIAYNAPFFIIQGNYLLDGNDEEIYCGLKRNQKKQFKRNKKEYSRLADHIGLLPLVIISPSDSELIIGGSESRRKFIDNVIVQYDRNYLDNLISYNKALSQRNALLKKFAQSNFFEQDSLDIWNYQLVELGKKIHFSRFNFIKDFTPAFQEYYERISGAKEKVGLNYQSHLNDGEFDQLLKDNLNKDRAMQYSTIGVHKDDLDFIIHDHSVKKYGSQGQQKSFLMALKLAQFNFIKKIKQITPIICLDDIYDKLDEERMKQLITLVSHENFGQIFITDTHEDRIKMLFKNTSIDLKQFNIKG